ncbi:MAG: ester cyclase [Gammaproteobacteria bacterium]|nr:ester cyclase [Gammaproteobacteria bacterium]MDH3432018.1 ester cyclase [Gammaproteobacteria bacterium]
MSELRQGAYGADDGLVDYILGITFEIWEQRGIELIHRYYGADCVVFALDGITRGAGAMVDGTRAMLEAYPDRLLLADDVIWSGSREQGYYSSHRIISPMTNQGATIFGPATGRRARILTIADCVVEEGVITREWLLRDNHALVQQLGFDPVAAAKVVAGRRDEESRSWIAAEIERLTRSGIPEPGCDPPDPSTSMAAFALQVIANNWANAHGELLASAYAPYAVMHRSPIELYSGREDIASHYAELRNAIRVSGVTIDHICVQPADSEGLHVAVRWTVAGTHSADYLAVSATGRPVFVLGATHWRIENDRVATEWTVFDGLGVLSQLV